MITGPVVRCPYMPDGFVAFGSDRSGYSILNVCTGHIIELPPIGFELTWPDPLQVKLEGDTLTSYLHLKWGDYPHA